MKQQKGKYRLKKGVTERVIRNEPDAPDDARDLTNKELFGERPVSSGLNDSEADEGASEGLGDGKIGRSSGNPEE